MIDPGSPDGTVEAFSDLPMPPTGSGVADLEVAYEQMKLADDGDGGDLSKDGREPDQIAVDVNAAALAEIAEPAADSAAHPS